MVKVREGFRGVHKRAWGALGHVSWRSVEPSLEPPARANKPHLRFLANFRLSTNHLLIVTSPIIKL
jgi:hypothetical protein